MESITLAPDRKIYFASDFHLGIPDPQQSRSRELAIIQWLDMASHDAQAIFLLGDLFDVWFEYKTVVPRGFVRFLGKLAELKDKGIDIYIFTGNHDFWMNDYFQTELDIPVITKEVQIQINTKIFRIGHGDGLGPGDHGYKLLKKVLDSPISQFLYKLLHPNVGMNLASWFSRRGPKHKDIKKEIYEGKDNEYLVQHSKHVLTQMHIDYFVYGHRHLPISFTFANGSQYYNLGDWISYRTYLMFDGTDCHFQSFQNYSTEIIIDSEI